MQKQEPKISRVVLTDHNELVLAEWYILTENNEDVGHAMDNMPNVLEECDQCYGPILELGKYDTEPYSFCSKECQTAHYAKT